MERTSKEKFSNWIFNSFNVTPKGLGLYRIFSALFIFCFLLPSTGMYHLLGTLPSDFYAPPPGPMMLFDGFPATGIFYLLHIILLIALLFLLTGYKTMGASLTTGIVFLIIKGLFYSVGKIDHDLLLSTMPLVMAFSNWGAEYSIDSMISTENDTHTGVNSWPLTLLALMLGFMMFTAGFPKILGGWLDPNTHATFGHFIKQYFVNSRQDLVAGYALQFDSGLFWELLDYGTIIFETGFLFAIVHPRTTRLFVSIAVVFHFSIMVLLNIPFLPNFIVYAAFLDWSSIDRKVRQWFPGRWGAILGLVTIFILIWIIILAGNQFNVPNLNSDLRIEEFYILLLSLPIALFYIGYQVYLIVRRY